MGLDMYLHKKSKEIKQLILNNLTDEDNRQELMYWRKDNLIHEWFCNNFVIENCEDVEITEEELLKLIEYLKDNIEDNDNDNDNDCIDSKKYRQEDIEKLNKIVEETDWDKEGIFYYAWW